MKFFYPSFGLSTSARTVLSCSKAPACYACLTDHRSIAVKMVFQIMTLMLLLTLPIAHATTYTASYENAGGDGGPPTPNPFKGLTYSGWDVVNNNGHLEPAQGIRYLLQVNPSQPSGYTSSISAGNSTAHLESLAIGCVSFPEGGSPHAVNCTLSVFASGPYSSHNGQQHFQLNYTNYNRANGAPMQIWDKSVGFKTLYFNITEGGYDVYLYIDELHYTIK